MNNAMISTALTVCILCCLGISLSPAAVAQDSQAAPNHSLEQELDRARAYFTNLELITQDGETVRFFDDVLAGKVVVINFIFTNCDGACPLMTHKLSRVRDRLEAYIADPLQFVSLSIDPERDTPAAMKEFAKTHHADHDGWTFLTGKPENLEYIVKRLGQFTGDIEAHSTMMLAGNVDAAHWIKIQPYEQPPVISEKLLGLILEHESSVADGGTSGE